MERVREGEGEVCEEEEGVDAKKDKGCGDGKQMKELYKLCQECMFSTEFSPVLA